MRADATWNAVREAVCTRCPEGSRDGACGLDAEDHCRLRQHMPVLVELVRDTRALSLVDYLQELRTIACARCGYEAPEGRCGRPDDVLCAVETQFPLIVETIQRALSSEKRGPSRTHHHKE